MGSGCGCGGNSGGGGGCSSSVVHPHRDQEPGLAVEIAPQVIAGSEQEWPVVSVNGTPIEPSAMAQELQYHPAADRQEALYMATRALVIRELLQQRIAELGLQARLGTGENQEEAVTRLLLEHEVRVPECDEASCQHYYASNRGRFHSAPLLAVRHILLESAPDDAEARSQGQTQAQILCERLAQFPEQFAELAHKYSACPSREQGGELGQISKGQTVPELERQLFTLAPGLAHKPLQSRYGWHVLYVDQRIEGQPLPYEAVATAIRTQLEQGVWQKAVVQYLQTLVGAADIRGIRLQGADSPLVQ